jgi:hypothetical protein
MTIGASARRKYSATSPACIWATLREKKTGQMREKCGRPQQYRLYGRDGLSDDGVKFRCTGSSGNSNRRASAAT